MSVSDTNKNRGTHGDSSFMLGGLPSSSENPPALAVGSVKCEECRFLEHNPLAAEHLPPYKCRKDGVRMYAPWPGNCDGFEKKKTNRDTLFDMDDYELALWIKSTACDAVISGAKTADYWLDWLRTEVDE